MTEARQLTSPDPKGTSPDAAGTSPDVLGTSPDAKGVSPDNENQEDQEEDQDDGKFKGGLVDNFKRKALLIKSKMDKKIEKVRSRSIKKIDEKQVFYKENKEDYDRKVQEETKMLEKQIMEEAETEWKIECNEKY